MSEIITIKLNIMRKKLNYEAPEVEVFSVNLEGCIAISQTDFTVNDPFSDHTDEEEW